MKRTPGVLLCLISFIPASCHSAFVEATVHNGTGAAVSLLEVDYPSASFGKEALPAGSDFHYRFKILGSGPTKVQWTDANHHEHTASGPELREGQEGTVSIILDAQSARWQVRLSPSR